MKGEDQWNAPCRRITRPSGSYFDLVGNVPKHCWPARCGGQWTCGQAPGYWAVHSDGFGLLRCCHSYQVGMWPLWLRSDQPSNGLSIHSHWFFIKHEYVCYYVSNLYFAHGVIIRIITIYECRMFDEGRVAVMWDVFVHLPASQRRNGELWWDGPSDGSGWLVGGWGPRSFRWAPSFVALDAASSDPLEFGVDPVNTWTFCLMLCFFMQESVLGWFCNRIGGLLVLRISLLLFYELPLENW